MMTMDEFRSLFHNGLIKQNTGLVQLLGLCPLLAISNNIINALSLGLATMLVMAASSGAVSGVRHFVPHEIRIPVFVLIIAALVTVIDIPGGPVGVYLSHHNLKSGILPLRFLLSKAPLLFGLFSTGYATFCSVRIDKFLLL